MEHRISRFIIGAVLALASATTADASPSEGWSSSLGESASVAVSVARAGSEGCSVDCYEMRNAEGQFVGYACVTGSAGYNCSAQQYTCGFNVPAGGCNINPGGDDEITISLADGRVFELAQYCEVAQRVVSQRRVGFLSVRQWNALEYRDRALLLDPL